MRTPAGGLLLAGTASTVIGTIFSRLLPSWTLDKEARERTSRTNNNHLAPPYWRKAIQTKLRQTLVFDPGGCTGRLRSCQFLGERRALHIRWTRLGAVMVVAEAGAFFLGRWMTRTSSSGRGTSEPFTQYVLRSIAAFPRSQPDTWSRQSQMARGYGSWEDERMSGNAMEQGA